MTVDFLYIVEFFPVIYYELSYISKIVILFIVSILIIKIIIIHSLLGRIIMGMMQPSIEVLQSLQGLGTLYPLSIYSRNDIAVI